MKLVNINQASKLLNLTTGQIIELLTKNIIKNGQIIDEEIYIPNDSIEYLNKNKHLLFNINELFDLQALSDAIHINVDTALLWVKLKKITPDRTYKNKYFFYRNNILKLMKELNSAENKQLKSRRNKTYIEGIDLYSNYLPSHSYNSSTIRKIFELINQEYKLIPNQQQVNLIVAECALQLLNQRLGLSLHRSSNLLKLYLQKIFDLKEYDELINNLIFNARAAIEFINTYPLLFEINYAYIENEDLLGFLYLSISNVGDRKKSGIYYTPSKVVNKLILSLTHTNMLDPQIRYFDPCCGTGNFLINLPDFIPWQKIWATDLDKNAVQLCRINMLLKYPTIPFNELLKRFKTADYLWNNLSYINDIEAEGPLVVLGNPPWGVNYSMDEKLQFSKIYEAASPMNVESFALFIERSINLTRCGDLISFVIPEAFLRVYTHLPIRRLVASYTTIKECLELGEQFKGVTCPSIILTLYRNITNTEADQLRCKDAMIYPNHMPAFTLKHNRKFTQEFDLLLDEPDYQLINKLLKTPNCTNLEGHAKWALGIVTGNNTKYLEDEKNKNNEIILKGSNIDQYKINYKNINYITFKKELFQQVAPEELYRAPEKLFYKFINKKLIFAYDHKKLLSLNSANILIPTFDNLNIKYILAILNSDLANFIYQKKFKAVKVLRYQLETIPIKIIDQNEQQYFINLVDQIINNNLNDQQINNIKDQINNKINELYELTEAEIKLLK